MIYSIIRRENNNSECYGFYAECIEAVSACQKYVEKTGIKITFEEFDSLFCLQEKEFEPPGSIGKYSLQVVWIKSKDNFC